MYYKVSSNVQSMTSQSSVLLQLRKGVLQFCVLACLRGEPQYGKEIAERLGTPKTLLDSEGTLYPLLSRLRKQGWVETTWRESRTGPPRRYYALTEAGEAALTDFSRVWGDFSSHVDEILKDVQ